MRRLNLKEETGADKGFIGIGTAVERYDQLSDGAFDDFPKGSGEDIEKTNVREDGDNKNINIQDPFSKRERPNKRASVVNACESFGERTLQNILRVTSFPITIPT